MFALALLESKTDPQKMHLRFVAEHYIQLTAHAPSVDSAAAFISLQIKTHVSGTVKISNVTFQFLTKLTMIASNTCMDSTNGMQ